jgi:hypothetical protein
MLAIFMYGIITEYSSSRPRSFQGITKYQILKQESILKDIVKIVGSA